MIFHPAVVLLLLPPVGRFAQDQAALDPRRTLRADAVELVAGREARGDEAFQARRGAYTYLFASDENRAAFLADPARYEIQWGGACGRMGPLSGLGSATIHAVHAGQIYVFASEACRKGFLANPEKLLERDDVPPAPSADEARRGGAWLERAVQAHGGAPAIDAASSWVARSQKDVASGGKTYVVRKSAWHGPGGELRSEEAWDSSWWATLATPAGAWSIAANEARELVPLQRHVFEKDLGRDLLALLRSRSAPGTVVAHQGPGSVGASAVERVALARGGATTVLSIASSGEQPGRVLAIELVGRGPSLAFGRVELAFDDYRTVGELVLPHAAHGSFDGADADELDFAWDSIELAPQLPAGVFDAPKSAQ